MDRTLKLALCSVAVGLVVLALKYLAFLLTGSVALYSDALESIINVVTAVAAFFAVRVSAVPPDANHPYGHHKAEYLSAVLEGVLIVVAALAILHEAYLGFISPKPLDAPFEGLLVNALASAINAGWCFILFRYGRLWRSPALVADAHHLWTDVITSGGVLIGVGLVAVTGWLQLDALLAGFVGLNIIWSGWKLMRDSISGLMDATAPPDVIRRVRDVISRHSDGALEAHDIRTRHAGRVTFVDFHLVVPGSMRVTESHAICDRIEAALRQDIEDAVVHIHVEPDNMAKNGDRVAFV